MNLQLEVYSEEIYRICVHEVGHLIVSRELGFVTKCLKIQYNHNGTHKASAGIILSNPNCDDLVKLQAFLEKRICILYAGAFAESIDKNGNYDNDHFNHQLTKGSAQKDFANIRELVRILRDIKFPKTQSTDTITRELEEIRDNLLQKTADIITEQLELIHGIAETLKSKVTDFNKEFELTENDLKEIPSFHVLCTKNDISST